MATFRFRLRPGVPPVSVEDWRRRARRKLPQVALSYIEGGADDLLTVRENVSAFRAWRLRQRMLTGISAPELATDVAGTPLSMPVALAPVGATGLAHWTGDVAAAKAAESCGVRAALSTASSYLLEEVAKATEHNHWFQLYPIGGRERIGKLLDRALAAGFTAVFVTVDVPVIGNREGERKWHMQLPWTVTPGRALHMARHWRWTRDVLRHKRIAAVHFLEAAREDEEEARRAALTDGVKAAAESSARMMNQLKDTLDWEDVAWMRERWKGKFYVKGILDPDDAARAVDEIGADGVVVSNHGGRQLDRCLATVDALPAVVARVGDRAEVYLDGGVRRGTDVVTALYLGARGVFIGRPFVYGLAAAGEQGVRSVLEIFREEITRALVLMGCPSVAALDQSWLLPARSE